MKIPVIRNVLDANDRIAGENRALFDDKRLYVINLMSSPGAGKTSLVEATILLLRERYRIGVIEGDIQDTYDADRIARLSIPVVQINTGGGCHLDANMVQNAAATLDLADLDLLVVENVGNLVCPAEFNIGEDFKVMLLSVTEGDDKPLKYPLMFKESKVLLITKIDLLPHLRCDLNRMKQAARAINPGLVIFEVSAYSGQGLADWHDWLRAQIKGTHDPS